jgi:hypothetical protein
VFLAIGNLVRDLVVAGIRCVVEYAHHAKIVSAWDRVKEIVMVQKRPWPIARWSAMQWDAKSGLLSMLVCERYGRFRTAGCNSLYKLHKRLTVGYSGLSSRYGER